MTYLLMKDGLIVAITAMLVWDIIAYFRAPIQIRKEMNAKEAALKVN